ncbi:hypothetical protein IMG5_045270, partial [Ichthyophthirius multifiliis]
QQFTLAFSIQFLQTFLNIYINYQYIYHQFQIINLQYYIFFHYLSCKIYYLIYDEFYINFQIFN